MIVRPFPPPELAEPDPVAPVFEPAPEVWAWVLETFIGRGSPLENEDHAHLVDADVGVLWTNADAVRQMRRIVGMAEMPFIRGHPWQKARQEEQLRHWFGGKPDFVLTFWGPHAAMIDDASWCALVEHELYHCAQAEDAWGAPRHRRSDGRPIFTLRGHDAEEFVSVVRRYGAGPSTGGVRQLVAAANQKPLIGEALVQMACGTCELQVA